MHTFEMTKVSISLRFPMQKKGFRLFSQWIVLFLSLVRPGKLFRNCLTNQRFSGRLFKFLIIYKKKCVVLQTACSPFFYIWLQPRSPPISIIMTRYSRYTDRRPRSQNSDEVISTALSDSSPFCYYMRRLHPKNKLFKKPRHYQLLSYFGEVAFINLFVSNHWELKYLNNMKISSVRVGRGNLVTRKLTLLKKFTKVFN